MEEEQKQQRIHRIIQDLGSKNERRVIEALKLIPHEGTPQMIAPMIELFQHHPSKDVRILLEKTLFNLKDQDCATPLIELLKSDAHKDVRQKVLSTIWQSGLDVSEELELLVDIAVNSDYLTVIEVITIIENLEDFNDDALTDSIAKMDEVVGKQSETQDLLVSLRQLLLDKLLGEG